jgi:hypothetical protein
VSLVRLWMGGAGLGVAAAEYGMAKGPFYRASGSEIWAFVDSNGVSKHRLRKVRKTGGGGERMGWSRFSRGGEAVWESLYFAQRRRPEGTTHTSNRW